MDPTDARRIVARLCAAEGVELGRVLGRDRTLEVVAIRRRAVLELYRRGMTWAGIARLLGRHETTIGEVGRRWRCDPLPGGTTI